MEYGSYLFSINYGFVRRECFFFFLHILMTDTDKLDCSYIVGHDIFFSRITQVILRTSLKHHQILIMFNYKNGII